MSASSSSLPALLMAALGALAATGCSALGASPTEPDDILQLDGGAGGDVSSPALVTDGGVSTPRQGSSLCGAEYSSCMPDDVGSRLAMHCGPDDAGAPDAGDAAVSTGPVACRVDPRSSPASVACFASGERGDSEACTTGADCRPGFECVGSPGRCRHYCCQSSTCVALSKEQSKDYFCDIQPMVDGPKPPVPVCQPVKPCQLLQADSCGPGFTCALVDSSRNLVSCVAVGAAKVGESCETEHCAAGLTCLGVNPPRCRQICDVQKPQCPKGQTCKTGWQILYQQGAGICE